MKVDFGDTGMEFPDTYKTVDLTEEWCKSLGIEFIRAKSEFSPEYTWRQFGPPATVTRWCCSVHKTAPQVIALREYTGKNNFTGMAFIGVRGSESLSRSEYDYVSLGEKHKGQYSCNPILEWNSAELFCYIYANDLILNEAYKKGNRRAGCLVCPRAAERNEYMSRECYPDSFDTYANIIRELYKQHLPDKTAKSIRYISLPKETMSLLREYRFSQLEQRFAMGDRWHNRDFVFTQENGEPMHPDSVTDWLNKFSKRHDLPHINAHAFRHTMASILYFNGVDSISISKRLGHAQPSTTTNIYAHIIEEADKKNADIIADVFLKKA